MEGEILLNGHFYTNIQISYIFYANSKKSRHAVQFGNNSISDSIRRWLQTTNGTHAMDGSGFNLGSGKAQALRQFQSSSLKPQGENKCEEGAGFGVKELRDGPKREKRAKS